MYLWSLIMAFGNKPGTLPGLLDPCRRGHPRDVSKPCLPFLSSRTFSDLLAWHRNQLIYEHLLLEDFGFDCLGGQKFPECFGVFLFSFHFFILLSLWICCQMRPLTQIIAMMHLSLKEVSRLNHY